jgi:AcrR family transcriptional regulator
MDAAGLTTRIPAPTHIMRKEPRQARSRATTRAILDAAAHILGERGWAGITTNAVADMAGVSIGSLYQYFPNKLALVEAVRRHHFDQVLTVLRAAVDSSLSREHRIAAFVDGMIAVHSRYPAAHRVLLEEAPRGQDSNNLHRLFETEYRRSCEALFTANAGRGPRNPDMAARVLAAAVAGVVHEAARQGMLMSPILRLELIVLVESYLRGRQQRRRSAASR